MEPPKLPPPSAAFVEERSLRERSRLAATTSRSSPTPQAQSLRWGNSPKKTRSRFFSRLARLPKPPPREFFDISRADLIRAVHTSKFLCGPAVLSNPHGTDVDYQRSERCDEIGTFISHNWGCSGTMKWLGLLFHFNQYAVWIAAVVLVVVFEALTLYFGWTTVE